MRAIRCQLTQKSIERKASGYACPPIGLILSVRHGFALAEGRFTKAQGFIIAHDGKSALLDMETLDKVSKLGHLGLSRYRWSGKSPMAH